MWIASTLGFFSIVKKGHPGEWQVRARTRRDIENLANAINHKPLLGDQRIIETGNSDYRFRIVVDWRGKQNVMKALEDTIDYSNFKSKIAMVEDQRGKLSAYHDIWVIMERFQPRKHKLGWGQNPEDRQDEIDKNEQWYREMQGDWSNQPKTGDRKKRQSLLFGDKGELREFDAYTPKSARDATEANVMPFNPKRKRPGGAHWVRARKQREQSLNGFIPAHCRVAN